MIFVVFDLSINCYFSYLSAMAFPPSTSQLNWYSVYNPGGMKG